MKRATRLGRPVQGAYDHPLVSDCRKTHRTSHRSRPRIRRGSHPIRPIRPIRLRIRRCRPSRRTSHRSRQTIRRVSHRNCPSHHRNSLSHQTHPYRRHCHRSSRPYHHRRYRCRPSRSYRRSRLTSRPCSGHPCASRCWYHQKSHSPKSYLLRSRHLLTSRYRLTSQSVLTHPCRPSARLRRPCLPIASRRTRLGHPSYHETTIHLPSLRMSRPTTRPAIPTCSAYRSRDPTRPRRRSTHDFCSGPPCVYPPAYFDCSSV